MDFLSEVKRRKITLKYPFPSDRLEKIRPASLKRLLLFYKWAYLDGDVDKSHMKRNPRLHPGLLNTMKRLNCSKLTALDYLNSIYVIRKGFVEPAIKSVKKSDHNIISDKEMRKLRMNFIKKIIEVIKVSGSNEVKKKRILKLRETDEALDEAINIFTGYEGLYTTKQVIGLLKEFKKLLFNLIIVFSTKTDL